MAKIKKEDVRGYYVGEEMVCVECITETEMSMVVLQDIIVSNDIENDDEHEYYCDRCGKSF